MGEKIGFSETNESSHATYDWEYTAGDMPKQYVGFWRRTVAYLLDGIIIGILVSIVNGILGRGEINPKTMFMDFNPKQKFDLMETLLTWLYFSFMESSSLQATIGKRVLKIQVTDLSGNRISFGRATIRHFSKILSAILLFIGFIMIAFTQKKQGLHDKIADTIVVEK